MVADSHGDADATQELATGAASGSTPGTGPGAAAAAGDLPPSKRPHRILVRVILGVATLLAILAIVAIWADRQLMNPDNWAKTSTQLLQKQTIRSAVAGYLVDQLYANIDVSAQLQSGLPSELAPLAGPLSGALHSVAEQGAERALAIPKVQSIWENANRTADEALVAIVKGEGKRVSINGGTVSLNLRAVVAELAQRLGLPASLSEKLPASVANLNVVTSNELGLVRNAAKALHALAVWLTIIAVLLYALAIFLARGYRRRTLMWVGGSLVFAGAVALLARKIGQGELVSSITSDASIEPAANDAYSVATGLLVQVASAAIIIGLPVILAGWLAGPARWATAVRHFLAPHLRERPALAFWITGALLAIVFIWGPIPATRNVVTMLVFTVLAFFGAYILRQQIDREFPDAEAVSLRASMKHYAHSMGEKVSHVRAATAPAGGPSSTADELERLVALRDSGALTDAEYGAAKRDLLSGS